MRLIFLGPPGAGKGTHAKTLAEKNLLAHLAAGDCLRRHIRNETKIGKKAKSVIEKGELVPDNIVNDMMEEEIFRTRTLYRGYILDGYPRTVKQAETLDKFCKKWGQHITLAVNFKTSEKVIMERLMGRLACIQCGKNFHVKNMPPKKEGICDKCGGELQQRKDDNPDTIKHRLEVYEKETAPLIEFYAKRQLLREINGDLSLENLQKVFEELFEELKAKK